MEETCSSETSADFQLTTRRYISEDRTLHNHCCENLKSYIIKNCYLIYFSMYALYFNETEIDSICLRTVL
jgi:hypothetical protein